MLPRSRNTTYAPGVDIKSADLNDLQDAVIAGKHGARRLMIPPSTMRPLSGAEYISTHRWRGVGTASIVNADLPLSLGDHLRGITVHGRTTGGRMSMRLIERSLELDTDTQHLAVGSLVASGVVAFGPTNLNFVVASRTLWFVQMPLAENHEVMAVMVRYDRAFSGVHP